MQTLARDEKESKSTPTHKEKNVHFMIVLSYITRV